ncbi:membrane protein [Mycobacterium tuberculosis variant microti OV254]|nr:membrane protein [Mycobacterium tuberculosis variant microti OV254]
MQATPSLDDFVRMQSDPAFQDLRHRLRRFVFPMTAFFLVWYLSYMLLATYVPGFMATRVFGDINIGVVLGFGQFASTFVITFCYVKFAGRTLDPRAAAIRAELEGAGE